MLNWFKHIFSNKEKVTIESFANLGVDMHSHLIAGIDDGVKTIDEAIEIIQFMQSIGYRKIITTPHTMAGGYDNTSAIILAGKEKLQAELQKRNIHFPIEVASEYYLDENFIQQIEEKSLLTMGENYVLFELSYINKPASLQQTLFDLCVAGYRPILAHPERYPYYANRKTLGKYEEIKDAGASLQVNLFSLVGTYGLLAQKTAEKLIDADLIDFVGTDIHNAQQMQYLEKCMQNKYVEKLLTNPNIKNNIL